MQCCICEDKIDHTEMFHTKAGEMICHKCNAHRQSVIDEIIDFCEEAEYHELLRLRKEI